MFPEFEFKLQDEYYKFRGWNKEGIPRAETLHKLGLDYVREDFEQSGIIQEHMLWRVYENVGSLLFSYR